MQSGPPVSHDAPPDARFERVCDRPARHVDLKAVRRAHRLLNKGCDRHCWGSNKQKVDRRTGEVEYRKAAWMCYAQTYTDQERRRRAGRYGRQYNLLRREEHLSGRSCDFFCGARPSAGGDYQFAILDGDHRHDGKFTTLDSTTAQLRHNAAGGSCV